jgi:riboflavin kinase/FMN adenylyltransferase
MKIHRGLAAFKPGRRKTAVAIGNFDGLHPGHQRILDRLGRIARRRRLRSVVLTFDPHPERALGRHRTLMIETLERRLGRLRDLGVEATLVTSFDRKLARLSPRDFIRKVLKEKLRAEVVVVGRDFRFGRNRAGDVRTLAREGGAAGIRTVTVPPVLVGGRVASSSLVRRLLDRGRVEEAARVLGRPYCVHGRVVPGRGVGRTLGYPTANLDSPNEILPRGVYITIARLGRTVRPSVTNIGFRPTFGPGGISLETVLLRGGRKLYGRTLEVCFLKRLRPERKFASADALARRIGLDIKAAQEYFRRLPLDQRPSPKGARSGRLP